ncbi:hypothetical protein CEXT_657911 [Caerostris extrusa]|uniref:Uncharacterized protein n=1 Tax=Caerostris extrusa TaxID=172846 RepID=A0AAV4XWA3_CAEEX|nr:hypothetical protein CEXT_657911 [Caerostris extrusa]
MGKDGIHKVNISHAVSDNQSSPFTAVLKLEFYTSADMFYTSHSLPRELFALFRILYILLACLVGANIFMFIEFLHIRIHFLT